MHRKTKSPANSNQLEIIDRTVPANCRAQFAIPRKTYSVRQSRCPGESKRPLVKAANLDGQIQACLDIVESHALRQFLASVVQEPEVREVISRPIGRSSFNQGYRIDAMRKVALAIRQQFLFGEVGRDVVYVGTLLYAIQYGLTSCVLGNADLSDVMFTIVRGPLHRLDDSDSGSACLLRLCMNWGNPDEAIELAEHLQQMMLCASRSMDRINALTKGA